MPKYQLVLLSKWFVVALLF